MPPFRYPSRLSTSLGAHRSSAARFLSHHHDRLDEAGPLACRLSSRSVIRLRGPDTVKFLQNLVTNDVRPLAQPPDVAADDRTVSSYLPTPNVALRSPPPIYAAMLTPEGRFLYDLFLYRQPRAEDKLDRTGSGPGQEEPLTVLADVDAKVSDELLEHLKRCRLRAKIEIENAAKEFFCWQRFGGDLCNKASSVQEPEAASVGWGKGVDYAGESAAQGNNHGWKWFKDPRLDCLGFRGIFPSQIIPPLVESDKETEEQHYLLWRLERGVAEGSTEIPKGEAIPLEYNLVGLNAISFDKGCYTGQELVARTHHRGVIRKRLLPLKFVDDSGKEVEQEVSPGSEVVDKVSSKKVGVVTTALGCRGMGLLRLDGRSPTLSIKEKDDVRVKVIRPDWWPAEWAPVHEQHTAAA